MIALDFDFQVEAGWLRFNKEVNKIVELSKISALNKTSSQFRNVLSRDVAKLSRVKVGIIKGKTKLYRASRRQKEAHVFVNLTGVKAAKLNPKQNKRGVRAGRHSFKGSFIAKVTSGYVGVFKRKSGSAYPIKAITIEVGDELMKSGDRLMSTFVIRKYQDTFRNEMSFRLRRSGLGG